MVAAKVRCKDNNDDDDDVVGDGDDDDNDDNGSGDNDDDDNKDGAPLRSLLKEVEADANSEAGVVYMLPPLSTPPSSI